MSEANPVKIFYRTNHQPRINTVDNFVMNQVDADSTTKFIQNVKQSDIVKYYITNESYALPLLMEALFLYARNGRSGVSVTLNLTKDVPTSLKQILGLSNNVTEATNEQLLLARRSRESINKLNTLKTAVGEFVKPSSTQSDISLATNTPNLFENIANILVKISFMLGARNASGFNETVQKLNVAKDALKEQYQQNNNLKKLSNQPDDKLIAQMVLNNERQELDEGYKQLAEIAAAVEADNSIGNKEKTYNQLLEQKKKYNQNVAELSKIVQNIETKSGNQSIDARIAEISSQKSALNAAKNINQKMYNELAQKLKISKDEINKYQKNLVVLEQQKQMAASQTNQLAQTKNKLEALQKTWDNQKTQNIARLQRDIENQKEMKRVLAEYLQKK
jgi:chromosome segregation ATPase